MELVGGQARTGNGQGTAGIRFTTSNSLSFTAWGLGHDEMGRSLSPETRRGWCPKPAPARPSPPKMAEESHHERPPGTTISSMRPPCHFLLGAY